MRSGRRTIIAQKRRWAWALLILALAAGSALAALEIFAAPAPMAFWMSASQWQHRNAAVAAYSLAASDFEAPASCAYLAGVDAYVWQLLPDLVAPYDTAEMILFGSHEGSLLAHRLTPSPGLVAQVAFVPVPAPEAALAGTTATITWALPSLEAGVVDHWELSLDGADQALPAQPYAVILAPGTHTVALKAVLAGSPKEHTAYGAAATFEVAG